MSDHCEYCGQEDDSHYHCGNCGEESGMMGHYVGNAFTCKVKCRDCNGFGYTKGSARGPWDKLDCVTCNGTGRV